MCLEVSKYSSVSIYYITIDNKSQYNRCNNTRRQPSFSRREIFSEFTSKKIGRVGHVPRPQNFIFEKQVFKRRFSCALPTRQCSPPYILSRGAKALLSFLTPLPWNAIETVIPSIAITLPTPNN